MRITLSAITWWIWTAASLSRSLIASGHDPITKDNAHFLDSTGAKGNFKRESYATLHVTDTINGLAVQKLDDAGNPINGVTFQLFRADQMERVGEGRMPLAPKANELPYMERTTKNMVDVPSIALDGTAYFDRIVKHDTPLADTYYIVEKDVPKGYAGAVDPIRVIVDDDGVHADAGVAGDDVMVSVGIGSLIDSMNHYGSNDGVEVTLHDVVAQLRVGTVNDSETPGFYRIGGWEKPAPEAEQQDLYLRYSDESATHEYVWNTDKPKSGTRFTTDEGFIRAAVKQDAESCDQNHGIGTWDDLGTKDITNLFTGSTVIHVTNHRVASLEVEKQVVIPEGLTGPADWKDKDFTFVFEFKDKDGKPLAGEFDARVFDAEGVQHGDDFKIASRGTHTLKHGEVMRVYGLPDGATYTVSEPVEQMPEGFTQTLPLDEAGKPTTATGAIKLGDTSRVLFENTYTPAPAILHRGHPAGEEGVRRRRRQACVGSRVQREAGVQLRAGHRPGHADA